MPKTQSDTDTGELLGLVPPLRLLPDEDANSYEALREALLRDLSPSTPYEHVLAENLVTIEWEAVRYRKRRDDLLIASARDLAAFAVEDPIGVSPSTEAKRQAVALFGSESRKRKKAAAKLEESGTNIDALLAEAYAKEIGALGYIDRHLADIETRRRRLRDDYDRLKAKRARPIPDAEIVTGNDD